MDGYTKSDMRIFGLTYEEFKAKLSQEMRNLYPEERQTVESFRHGKKEFMVFRDRTGHEMMVNLRDCYDSYTAGRDFEGILFETIIRLHKSKKFKK